MKYSEQQALAKIAAYCSKAERCEFDVIRKLSLWEMDKASSLSILNRLKSEKFLNDERFCRAFIKDKARFNKWGETKIRYELKKKQISSSIINDCFDEFEKHEFEDQLFKILEAKAKSVKANNKYEKQTKLIRFASSKGYSFDQTKRVLTKLDQFEDDEYFE